MSQIDYLGLYSEKCLRCAHLVEGATKKYKQCFTDRNPECPASEVRIVFTGLAQRCAKEVRAARAKGDLAREARVLAYAASRGKIFEQKFLESLK
jgi:hypothetical protein